MSISIILYSLIIAQISILNESDKVDIKNAEGINVVISKIVDSKDQFIIEVVVNNFSTQEIYIDSSSICPIDGEHHNYEVYEVLENNTATYLEKSSLIMELDELTRKKYYYKYIPSKSNFSCIVKLTHSFGFENTNELEIYLNGYYYLSKEDSGIKFKSDPLKFNIDKKLIDPCWDAYLSNKFSSGEIIHMKVTQQDIKRMKELGIEYRNDTKPIANDECLDNKKHSSKTLENTRSDLKQNIPKLEKGGREQFQQIIRDRVKQGGGRETFYAGQRATIYEDGKVAYVIRPNGEFWTILRNTNL